MRIAGFAFHHIEMLNNKAKNRAVICYTFMNNLHSDNIKIIHSVDKTRIVGIVRYKEI